jgi:hypothetical protein
MLLKCDVVSDVSTHLSAGSLKMRRSASGSSVAASYSVALSTPSHTAVSAGVSVTVVLPSAPALLLCIGVVRVCKQAVSHPSAVLYHTAQR